MASEDLIHTYNRDESSVFFLLQVPRKNAVQFRFENKTKAVLVKSLGEERQIRPSSGHMTVQNLDLSMDVDSLL